MAAAIDVTNTAQAGTQTGLGWLSLESSAASADSSERSIAHPWMPSGLARINEPLAWLFDRRASR